MFSVTLALLVCLIGLVYLFFVWHFDYWTKRGVPGPKPQILFGNTPSAITQKRHMIYDLNDIYRAYKNEADFVGFHNGRMPQLMTISPEMVRRVFVNDFKHFHDNTVSEMIDEKSDFLFASNPFSLIGEKWKERRAEVTTGMAMSRVKATFPVTLKVCKDFIHYIKKRMSEKPTDGLNAKNICLLYTSEISCDCILGIQAGNFTDDPTPIYEMAKQLSEGTFTLIIYFTLVGLLPSLKRFYKARFISKPLEKFFIDLTSNAINMRKKNPVDRIDFMSYIQQLQEKKKLSINELTAHSMTFFLDGFETTGGALTNCLLLIARSEDVQTKLREEIVNNLNGEEIDFDKLIEMPYLDACVHESLRIFPPGLFSAKLCTEDIELTNKDKSTVRIAKGETIVLPLYSIMTDEEYYPEPQEFKPERFMPENGGVKKYRDLGLFLSFGDGPRICLGMRFALVQIKAAIVTILQNFNIKVNPKTRKDNLLDRSYFLARLDGDVWLEFEDLKETI